MRALIIFSFGYVLMSLISIGKVFSSFVDTEVIFDARDLFIWLGMRLIENSVLLADLAPDASDGVLFGSELYDILTSSN